MDRRKRGQLVLICNTEFKKELELSIRKGTEQDIAVIKEVFGKLLKFDIQVKCEQKATEMLQTISAAARNEDNKESDCIVVFILSHGAEGGQVYGTDEAILISKLMEPLRSSDSLVGKPKMVFMQSCRGKELDRGKNMVADDGASSVQQQVLLPAEADFLFVYSTVDGYVSFLNPSKGSWFIQFLCKELETNWQKLEMIQMLTRVCRALAYNFASYAPANRQIHNLKQVSSVTTTLTKAIRFFQV